MALDPFGASATDTFDEKPAFIPEADLRNVTTENQRLRREVETLQRSQRELEETTRNGDGTSRRLTLLRNALVQKDQEILSLRTHQVTRERSLHELREAARRAERDRAELESRLRDREGVFAAIEQERSRLTQALENARREREQTASTLMQADQAVHQWRVCLDETSRARDAAMAELTAARAVATELQARVDALGAERQRLTEQKDREAAAIRAEVKTAQDAEMGLLRQEVLQLHARLENLRETTAIARRGADDDHAEEVASFRLDVAAAQAEVEAAMAKTAEVQTRVDALEVEQAMLHGALEAARASGAGTAYGAAFVRAELRVERDAHAVTKQALREARFWLSEGELASAQRRQDRHAKDTVDALWGEFDELRKSLANERSARLAAESERDALRASLATEQAALQASSETVTALTGEREQFVDAASRIEDLERELEATREALGTYATESSARVETAEREAAELRIYRDRYARRLATAMSELKRISSGATEEAHTLASEVKLLSASVGRLTARLVVEAARAHARDAGRKAPLAQDVDEAIALVSEEVPERVAQELWGARSSFVTRCGAMMS